jgi:hypothetical protein
MSETFHCGADNEAPAFRELLRDCERLYRSCATDFAERHPDLIHDSPEGFLERMLDLHRGLVLKVFVEIAHADQHISTRELGLARELFDHAWGKRLTDDQLREAIQHYEESTHLRWDSLLWPFERLSSFRPRAGDLFAVVQRLALSVASANRRVDPRAVDSLQWIIAEMQRVLNPVPIAGETTVARAEPPSRSAVKEQEDFEIFPSMVPGQAQSVRRVNREVREKLDDVLAELDGLIGLTSIKQEVRELVDFLKIQKERTKFDLPQTPITLHAVFTGNPGTGKTTVARVFGRILGALGILARGHLIETDRCGLVAEYAGQTAPKTNQRIDEALDGVLFIDEAYSLVAESGDDPYGTEALQILLKRMEDDRARVVVILAGYPGPMATLLDANPGLSSRFGRTFAFPDYNAVELGRVFTTFSKRDRYQLPARTRAKLLLGFQYLLGRRDEHFGNGRLARTVFEHSVRRLASRLVGVRPLTKVLLTTLEPQDVVMEGVPAAIWTDLDNDARPFRLPCPGCGNSSRLPQRLLGCRVRCHRCNNEFEADWGEPGEQAAGRTAAEDVSAG